MLKMLKNIFLTILIGVFLLSSIGAQASDKIYLGPIIKEARENNPEILAAKKRWEAAKARVPQAKSLDDPWISLQFEKTPRNPVNLSKTMSEDRMLSISQALPFFGKLPLKGKIALVESQMFGLEFKDKELEIINEVKSAYFDLFMNYKEIELNEHSLSLLLVVAKSAQAKYSLGAISQEELFKINLEIAKLNTIIENLKQEQFSKQSKLNSLLNRDPESLLAEPVLEEDADFDQDITNLYKLTLENQPTLLIFSFAIEKNKYAKSLAKRSFFPDFFAQLVERGFTTGTIGPWDLMLSFSLPLWFWTKQRYEVKEAIANLEEARAAYEAMRNKALAETKDLYTKIEIAKNKIGLYKNNLIPMLEGSINSSLASFASGKGDFMALLDNERMLVDTKMDYYKALVEYNMNLADLERAVGADLK